VLRDRVCATDGDVRRGLVKWKYFNWKKRKISYKSVT
jgi:hypothetical protein